MSIESTATFRLSSEALSVALADENIVLSLKRDRYFGIRGAARHLLEGLRDGMTVEAMVAQIQQQYDVTPDVARRDVETILPKLIAADIVSRVD